MSDKEVSVRDLVEAAYDKQVEEKTNDEPVSVSDSARDDIPSEPSHTEDNQSNDVSKKDDHEPPKDSNQLSDDDTQPLAHWSAEEISTFNELDVKARKLYMNSHKRQQADYTKKSQGLAEERRIAENFKKTISAHEEHLRNIGVDPFNAIDKLLATERLFRQGTPHQKLQALQKIVQDYGINMDLSQQSEQQAAQQYDPQTVALLQKVQTLENRQQAIEQDRMNREYASLENQIILFQNSKDEKGEVKYPHFETLRLDMSEMLQKGMAKTLEEAYNKSLRLNDDLHQEHINRQYNSRNSAEDAIKKTAASKNAGFNVKGSGRGTITEPSENLTMRQTIERAYDRQQKRTRI